MTKGLSRAKQLAKEDAQYLDTAIETGQRRLARAIRELERRVISLAADAGAGQKSFSLRQALKLQSALENVWQDTYGDATMEHVRGYRAAARRAQEYLKALPSLQDSFATVSNELVSALQQQSLDVFAALGAQAQNRIAQALMNSALTGWRFDRLATEVAGSLTGHNDVRGRPLAEYARVYAQDGLMETYAHVHQQAGQRAGLTHYLYFGTAVRDSRPFCLERMGKVFTAEEVQSWESLDWAGKKSGPILVVRGGWNCRHQLLPVDPEWVEEDLGQ